MLESNGSGSLREKACIPGAALPHSLWPSVSGVNNGPALVQVYFQGIGFYRVSISELIGRDKHFGMCMEANHRVIIDYISIQEQLF